MKNSLLLDCQKLSTSNQKNDIILCQKNVK